MFQRIPAPLPGDQAPRPASEVQRIDQAAGEPPKRESAGELPQGRRVDEVAISREAEDRLLRERQQRPAASQGEAEAQVRDRQVEPEARQRADGAQVRERPDNGQVRERPDENRVGDRGVEERVSERQPGPQSRPRVDDPAVRVEREESRRADSVDALRREDPAGQVAQRRAEAEEVAGPEARAEREQGSERIVERQADARVVEQVRVESREEQVRDSRQAVEARGIGGEAPRGAAALDDASQRDNRVAAEDRAAQVDVTEVVDRQARNDADREVETFAINREVATGLRIDAEDLARDGEVSGDEKVRAGIERVADERAARSEATRDQVVQNRLNEARAVRPSDSRSEGTVEVRGDAMDQLREAAARLRMAAESQGRPDGAMGAERSGREIPLPFPDGGRGEFEPDLDSLLEELDGQPDPPESTLPEELFG